MMKSVEMRSPNCVTGSDPPLSLSGSDLSLRTFFLYILLRLQIGHAGFFGKWQMRLGKKRAGAFHNACFGLCGFCLLFGLFAFSVVSPQTITNSTIFKLNVIAHRIEENVPVFKEIKSRRKVPKLSHPL